MKKQKVENNSIAQEDLKNLKERSNTATNIYKVWKELEKGIKIDVQNWEDLKDFIWKQQMKIERLTESRDNWKDKYMGLKES